MDDYHYALHSRDEKLTLHDAAIIFRKKMLPTIGWVAVFYLIVFIMLTFGSDIPMSFSLPLFLFLGSLMTILLHFRDIMLMFSGNKQCYLLTCYDYHSLGIGDKLLSKEILRGLSVGKSFVLSYIYDNKYLLKSTPIEAAQIDSWLTNKIATPEKSLRPYEFFFRAVGQTTLAAAIFCFVFVGSIHWLTTINSNNDGNFFSFFLPVFFNSIGLVAGLSAFATILVMNNNYYTETPGKATWDVMKITVNILFLISVIYFEIIQNLPS